MTKLPLGLAALMAVAYALEGCASKPAVALAPPPASDFPAKRAPGWSATQVTASARYVRISGAMPEAKGALAFLADEAALRAGTLALTKAQADAALAELTRITKREARSTPTVTVATGNAARMTIGDETKGVAVTIGGRSFAPRPDVVVELEVSPQVETEGFIRMNVHAEVTTFEGFVEYKKPINVTDGSEVKSVRVPEGFYQPIFSTHMVKANVRMASGGVTVLRAERIKADVTEGLTGRDGQKLASVSAETLLVFLTAEIVPTK